MGIHHYFAFAKHSCNKICPLCNQELRDTCIRLTSVASAAVPVYAASPACSFRATTCPETPGSRSSGGPAARVCNNEIHYSYQDSESLSRSCWDTCLIVTKNIKGMAHFLLKKPEAQKHLSGFTGVRALWQPATPAAAAAVAWSLAAVRARCQARAAQPSHASTLPAAFSPENSGIIRSNGRYRNRSPKWR